MKNDGVGLCKGVAVEPKNLAGSGYEACFPGPALVMSI